MERLIDETMIFACGNVIIYLVSVIDGHDRRLSGLW